MTGIIPAFFPLVFPIVFSHGNGGHYIPCLKYISLQTWAKWALSHYSRCFAQNPVFMYVVFDLIQCYVTALGYSLLVKSQSCSKTQEFIVGIMHKGLYKVAELDRTTNTFTDLAVLALEQLVQLVSVYISYLFAKYYKYRLQF